MVERGNIWRETASGISLIGSGFGAFGGVAHALQLDNTVPQHAHNDALELLWETGLTGFCLVLIFMRQLMGPITPSRLVLIVFIIEGCLAFRYTYRPLYVSLRWLPAMLFGIGLWYGVSLGLGELLVTQGASEPNYDKAMSRLTLAVRVMPLTRRFREYVFMRSVMGKEDGTLQSK